MKFIGMGNDIIVVKMLILAIALRFLSPPLFADTVEKRQVVSACYAPKDPKIAAGCEFLRAKLRGCGFEVSEVNGAEFSPEPVRLKVLAARRKDKDATVFIDSHGIAIKNELFFGDAPGEDGKRFPADPIVDSVRRTTPLFVDACYSGYCNKNYLLERTRLKQNLLKGDAPGLEDTKPRRNLGTSSQPRETSHSQINKPGPISDFLADLLCSSARDCELWWKVDTEKKGAITGRDLNRYFTSKQFSHPEYVVKAEPVRAYRYFKTSDPTTGEIEKAEMADEMDFARTVNFPFCSD